jgi:hypothetical protein
MIQELKKGKRFKPSLSMRIGIVMSLGFLIQLFFSCDPPDSTPIDINYNYLSVKGVDNSGQYMSGYYDAVDTMYSEAVAFKLTLSDSSYYYYASNRVKSVKPLSFSSAMALSIDDSYTPVNQVKDIKTTTLFDIDNELRAGADISSHILYSSGDMFELYENHNYAISTLNAVQNDASGSVYLFLKKAVQNTMLQFKVEITLDNDAVLVCKTDTVTIIIP